VARHFVTFDGEAPSFCAILQGRQHGGGDRLGFSRGYEPAGDAFLNEIGKTSDICGDDGNPAE